MTSRTYIISSIIALASLALVLARVTKQNVKNQSLKMFEGFVVVTMLYTLLDGVWGFSVYLSEKMLLGMKEAFYYGSISVGIVVGLVWYEYAMVHLYMITKSRDRKLYLIDAVPALIGLQFVAVNYTTNYFFHMNSDGTVTFTGAGIFIWIFYIFYHVWAFVRTSMHYKNEEKTYEKMRSLVVRAVTVLYILGATLQYALPILPFFAMSLMLGSVAILIYNISIESENEVLTEHKKENYARNMMITSLADEYDIIFWVNKDDNSYRSFSNTQFYRNMGLKTEGDDFFEDAKIFVPESIYKDDVEYVTESFVRENVMKELEETGRYTIVYRIVLGGAIMYYETKFVDSNKNLGDSNIMVGIKNVDARERRELSRKRDIRNLERKELEYRKALQEALENQNEIYAEMLHMQSSGVIVTNMENRIIICNEAASDVFDMPLNIMMDDIFPDVVEDCLKDGTKNIREKLGSLKNKGDEVSYEYPVYHLDNRVTYIKAESKLTTLSNKTSVVITSLADITTNKEMEQKLFKLSETDSLTGLLNRDSGFKRAEQFIKRNVDGMFCIIDVNKFKHINDTYGHPIGDKVLKAIAGCLKRAFRRKDILMRIGGDEFAIFAVDIKDEEVGGRCLDRLFEDIKVIAIPGLEDQDVVSVSIGAIMCPGGRTKHFDEMYKLADSVMYTCKGKGGNNYAFYKQETDS